MYICSWHDGSIKSENVLTKSFMLCHLLILTSVMWLAKQALDLSFYVVACHNDRQVLNNYFEPCTGTLHTLCSRFKSVNRSRFPLHWLSFSC